MNNLLLFHLKKHFEASFDMLKNHISNCPDEIWNKKYGGYIFWQQLLHAFESVIYWMRNTCENTTVINPIYHADLDKDAEKILSKDELMKIICIAEKQAYAFMNYKEDKWLKEYSVVNTKMLNIDVIESQIRHIQYHVGHCNCILRELGYDAVNWLGYLEKTEES